MEQEQYEHEPKGTLRIDPNDIVGDAFGYVEVLEYLGHQYNSPKYTIRHYYKCYCKRCKRTMEKVERYDLLCGRTRSCGRPGCKTGAKQTK